MVRIRFNINQQSAFLGVMSGNIHVEEVDFQNISSPAIKLFTCKFKKERHSTGFTAMEYNESIPSDLFEVLRPVLMNMIRSYFKGMLLSKDMFDWVSTSGDESYTGICNLDLLVQDYIKKISEDRT